jgi:hypothetical protein
VVYLQPFFFNCIWFLIIGIFPGGTLLQHKTVNRVKTSYLKENQTSTVQRVENYLRA